MEKLNQQKNQKDTKIEEILLRTYYNPEKSRKKDLIFLLLFFVFFSFTTIFFFGFVFPDNMTRFNLMFTCLNLFFLVCIIYLHMYFIIRGDF